MGSQHNKEFRPSTTSPKNSSRIENWAARCIEFIEELIKNKRFKSDILRFCCKGCSEYKEIRRRLWNQLKGESKQFFQNHTAHGGCILWAGDEKWDLPMENGQNNSISEDESIETSEPGKEIKVEEFRFDEFERVESEEGEQEAHTKIDTELDGVKAKFDKWLKLEDRHIIDVVLGTVIANSLEGDSVYLYVVGPPSSGKTEIIRSLNDYHTVHYLSNLTAQTLISGWKENSKFENSLLLRLKNKGKTILAVKDFTTVLMMRNEARQEILSQIREIADGYYNKSFGMGNEVSWEGKLGIVTGVTLVIDEHHAVHQILGERFLYYRIFQDNPQDTARMAQEVAGKENLMRGELRKAVKEFLEHREKVKIRDVSIGAKINEKLINLVCFVAGARTGVSRDRYTQTINYLPDSEGPSRLMKQLFTLGCGIAIAQGKNEIDEEVYNILKKVGRDTLPSYRNLILKEMWARKISGEHREKLKTISEFLRQPIATINLYLEELMVIGLADKNQEEDSFHEKMPYLWRLSDKCYDLIQKSEVYEGNEVNRVRTGSFLSKLPPRHVQEKYDFS